MRKNIVILVTIFSLLLVGCSMGKDLTNTPTKQVEIFFNKYQTLDKDVLDDLDHVVAEENFTADQREKYRDIMKKGYQKLKYDIKDEKLNGDSAKVTVDIEVIDYSKVMSATNSYLKEHPEEFQNEKQEHDPAKFLEYRLKKLEDVKDTVRYTLDLELHKKNDQWRLDDLGDDQEAKIHGMYVY